MRGRKIQIGKTSITLYARHRAKCPLKSDNSGIVKCDCIRWIQYKDGTRETTGQWTWPKAESEARRIVAKDDAGHAVATDPNEYTVERAIDEWIAERDKDELHNVKARYLTAKLLDWSRDRGYEFLHQIQKQALREWRTSHWKYRNKNSSSLKVHWSVLLTFFNWCVENDLVTSNPCPSWKGKIEPTEVVPLTQEQIDTLIAAVDLVPGWPGERRLKARAILLLMRWSGMSIGDVVCLEVTRLIGQHVYNKRHKTKKQFSVPIPLWVAELVRTLPNSDPKYFFWHRRKDGTEVRRASIVSIYGSWVKEAFDAAGLRGSHSHQLRHSFVTYHRAKGVSYERIAEWLGHDTSETKKTYDHIIPERQELSDQTMRDSWAKMGLDAVGNPIFAEEKHSTVN